MWTDTATPDHGCAAGGRIFRDITKTFNVTTKEGQSTEAIKDYTTTNGFVTVLLPS